MIKTIEVKIENKCIFLNDIVVMNKVTSIDIAYVNCFKVYGYLADGHTFSYKPLMPLTFPYNDYEGFLIHTSKAIEITENYIEIETYDSKWKNRRIKTIPKIINILKMPIFTSTYNWNPEHGDIYSRILNSLSDKLDEIRNS